MEQLNKGRMRLGVKIAVNLILMMFIGVFLLWVGTLWLDYWTDHGEFVVVPEVKGKSYDEACVMLEEQKFEVILSDSLYDNKTRPGTVLEQNPKVGAKVKAGRTVYLTVNAFAPRAVTLPSLTDVSLRQAQSILQGLGLKNIVVKEVPSEFKDLVLAATRDGKRLAPGARVPVDARIVLEVGAGLSDEDVNNDSTDVAGDGQAQHIVESLDLI